MVGAQKSQNKDRPSRSVLLLLLWVGTIIGFVTLLIHTTSCYITGTCVGSLNYSGTSLVLWFGGAAPCSVPKTCSVGVDWQQNTELRHNT